jgi:HEPN domain-containing protein
MPPDEELASQWLEYAVSDFRSAEILLRAEPPRVRQACFHCQQCVEKSLKAFLVKYHVEFEKSHLLDYLLDLCAKQDPSFDGLHDAILPLAFYAVPIRYPHAAAAPALGDAGHAMNTAKMVLEFVLNRLPKEVHPSDTLQ